MPKGINLRPIRNHSFDRWATENLAHRFPQTTNTYPNMNFRLEYNQSQGKFHHERHANRMPNTNGWITIAENIEDPKITQFCYYMKEFYKNKLDNKHKPNLKEETVKAEWAKFDSIHSWITQYQNKIREFHNES